MFDKNTFEKWEDLEEHFRTEWPAGSPGSAHSEHEYMYENNGDLPPDEPWNEYWIGSKTLQAIFSYFTTHKYWYFMEYIAWIVKYGELYEFGNVTEQTKTIKRASKKRIPKKRKLELRAKAGIERNHPKLEYYFDDYQYFVKHPDFGFLVNPDQIITRGKKIYL